VSKFATRNALFGGKLGGLAGTLQWEFNTKAPRGKDAKWIQQNPQTGLRQFALRKW